MNRYLRFLTFNKISRLFLVKNYDLVYYGIEIRG